MKFRPGTNKICAQNTWDNLGGKQMLLVTCVLDEWLEAQKILSHPGSQPDVMEAKQ